MADGFRFDFGDDDAAGAAPAAAAAAPAAAQPPAAPPPRRWVLSPAGVAALIEDFADEELATRRVPLGGDVAPLRHLALRASELPPERCGFAHMLRDRDVVPGVYEGGFKLWSCAGDLCSYLSSLEPCVLQGRSVMEAGCGHGLPGTLALRRGAARVTFHDYNEEVLRELTVPNVAINAGQATAAEWFTRAEFWAGDWSELAAALPATERRDAVCQEDPDPAARRSPDTAPQPRFDVILSTDTVYTVDAAKGFCRFVHHFLARPHGVAYVGAKTVYFGTGGGVEELAAQVDALRCSDGEEPGLVFRRAHRVDDGQDNVREVVTLSWNSARS